MALLANPFIIMGLVIALLSGAEYVTYKAWQSSVKREGAVSAERDQAIQAGATCSLATEKLARESKARETKLRAAIGIADKKAKLAQARADATLTTMPKFPNDACASAAALNKDKLEERAKLRGVLEGIKP